MPLLIEEKEPPLRSLGLQSIKYACQVSTFTPVYLPHPPRRSVEFCAQNLCFIILAPRWEVEVAAVSDPSNITVILWDFKI